MGNYFQIKIYNMVQVGTAAFAEDDWCHSTTVTITGVTLADSMDHTVSEFSDGYQLTLALTMGKEGDANEEEGKHAVGVCIMGEGTGAVCIAAMAGDDTGVLAANGLHGKMFAAGGFKAEAENDMEAAAELPRGAWAKWSPAGVNDEHAPETADAAKNAPVAAPAAATPESRAAEKAAPAKKEAAAGKAPAKEVVAKKAAAPVKETLPVAKAGVAVEAALAKDAILSVSYFQPKEAKAYAGLWRFNAKDSVTGYAFSPTDKTNKKCMTAELTGASALVAGAAIAFGAAALF